MTLIDNNFEQKIEQVKADKNSKYLLINITIQERKIILANVYDTNQDNTQFYRTLFQKFSEYDIDRIIMCGDWNFVLNPSIDYENYLHINNPRSRQVYARLFRRKQLVRYLEDYEWR